MKNRFKVARTNCGLTQKEVAQMLNVSYTTYNRYERGYVHPRISKIRELAAIFNVSIDYLLINDIEEPSGEVPYNVNENFIKKYQQLDLRGKTAVCATLDREYISNKQ